MMSNQFNCCVNWSRALLACVLLTLLSALLSACGSNNSSPPEGLDYSYSELILTTGLTIVPLSPNVTAGAVTSYGVSPALPAGLVLNTTTGIITGTPAGITAKTRYAIRATNSAGVSTTELTLTVQSTEALPTGLNYNCDSCSFPVGLPINPLRPTNSGGQITGYSVSPDLPTGLSIDLATGIISGTPTTVTSSAFPTQLYTVTGTNGAGIATTGLNFTITPTPESPALLSYGDSTYTLFTGEPIVPITPLTEGAEITNYSVDRPLPAGLSINAVTGVISGTPSGQGNPNYEDYFIITGSNAAGSVQDVLAITIRTTNQPPTNFRYQGTYFNYSLNLPITPLSPVSLGGEVTEYSVTPDLPAGLSLNTSDGYITGTPTAVTPAATYTITGTNSIGQAQTSVTLATQTTPPGFQQGGAFYYDGATSWTRITSTTYTYQAALNFCASLPHYNGGKWEVPADMGLFRLNVNQIIPGIFNGQNWVFDRTWITLFIVNNPEVAPNGYIFLDNHPYIGINTFIANGPSATTAQFNVTCSNTKAP